MIKKLCLKQNLIICTLHTNIHESCTIFMCVVLLSTKTNSKMYAVIQSGMHTYICTCMFSLTRVNFAILLFSLFFRQISTSPNNGR